MSSLSRVLRHRATCKSFIVAEWCEMTRILGNFFELKTTPNSRNTYTHTDIATHLPFACAVSFDQLPCGSGPGRNFSVKHKLLVTTSAPREQSLPPKPLDTQNRGNTGTTKTIKSEKNTAANMCKHISLIKLASFVTSSGLATTVTVGTSATQYGRTGKRSLVTVRKERAFCDTQNASMKKTDLVTGGSTELESERRCMEKIPAREFWSPSPTKHPT